MTRRKFYRQVFTVEVLSEEPIGPDIDMADLAWEIKEGDSSGNFKMTKSEVLDGKQVADALAEQGSEPGFFMLDENGEDTDG